MFVFALDLKWEDFNPADMPPTETVESLQFYHCNRDTAIKLAEIFSNSCGIIAFNNSDIDTDTLKQILKIVRVDVSTVNGQNRLGERTLVDLIEVYSSPMTCTCCYIDDKNSLHNAEYLHANWHYTNTTIEYSDEEICVERVCPYEG